MMISIAKTDDEINRCYPVMVQLRPHLTAEEFLQQVKLQQQQDGYQLVWLANQNVVKAVAGYRIQHMLAHGKFLYVDDLVTDQDSRSKGYGDALLDWLVEAAHRENCSKFQLDSGVQRLAAHRFYFRKRMTISSYHFNLEL